MIASWPSLLSVDGLPEIVCRECASAVFFNLTLYNQQLTQRTTLAPCRWYCGDATLAAGANCIIAIPRLNEWILGAGAKSTINLRQRNAKNFNLPEKRALMDAEIAGRSCPVIIISAQGRYNRLDLKGLDSLLHTAGILAKQTEILKGFNTANYLILAISQQRSGDIYRYPMALVRCDKSSGRKGGSATGKGLFQGTIIKTQGATKYILTDLPQDLALGPAGNLFRASVKSCNTPRAIHCKNSISQALKDVRRGNIKIGISHSHALVAPLAPCEVT